MTASAGQKTTDALDAVIPDDNVGEHWYIKGGVKKAFSDLGATNIYGEYGEVAEFTDNTEGQMWGVGIEQDLDAVASTVYLNYRNWAAQTSSTRERYRRATFRRSSAVCASTSKRELRISVSERAPSGALFLFLGGVSDPRKRHGR